MATYTWDGTTGSYDSANDWSPNTVPQPGDTAVIASGTVASNGGTISGVAIQLDAASGATTEFDLNGSTLSLAAGAGSLKVGNTATAGSIVLGSTGTTTLELPVTIASPSPTPVTVSISSGTLVNADYIAINDSTPYFQGFGPGIALENDGFISVSMPDLPFGTVNIGVSLTGIGAILLGNQGRVDAMQGVASTQGIVFNTNNGTFEDDDASAFQGTISNFVQGDVIQLTSTGQTSYQYTSTGSGTGYLTLTDANAGTSVNINFSGNYTTSDFTVVTNNFGGGNNITAITTDVPCFVTGTRILTARGEIAVESLREGDMVMALHAGGLRPVRWVGHRRLDLRTHPAPEKVWPIRVQAGAFAEGRPHRDLWLSPEHAVFVDGALIRIKDLVNGASIVQVKRDEVTYWHVELEGHDVLLAEGMPAESYLDLGNRAAFENGGACLELHPDFQPRHWDETCVPVVSGPAIAPVKAQLLRRAREVLGYALTEEAGLHLLADGREIAYRDERDGVYCFQVPEGAKDVFLVSRTWVPAEMEAESGDARRLGVCVRRLLLDDGRDVPLDDTALAEGWHGAEGEAPHRYRWTGGMARLPSGAELVSVELTGKRAYWAEPEAAGAAEAPTWQAKVA